MPAPPIPIGLGTKAGLLGAAIAALYAGVTAVLHGDHTPETITGVVMAGVQIAIVVKGRTDQASAHILAGAQPPVLAPHLADPALDDPDHVSDEPMITNEDLIGRTQGSATLEEHTGLKDPA
jgi:ABC-type uncharacterized transport system permease subunit